MIFVAHHNSPKVAQPRKQTLDLPASFVTAHLSPILRFRSLAIGFVRRDHLNFKLLQLFVQRVGIIGFVADQLLRSLIGEAFGNGSLDQFDFVERSRFRIYGERKTKAVCHCHEFRTLAPLGFSDFEAPFLAEANVPSIKVSDKSSLPRVRKSSANVSNTFFSLPSLTQVWKRRWQVWSGGNLSGKSDHLAPLRKIHRTPFKTSRAGRAGLPRVWISLALSNNGSINVHCSSVNSSRRAIREFYQTIFEMASNYSAINCNKFSPSSIFSGKMFILLKINIFFCFANPNKFNFYGFRDFYSSGGEIHLLH